MRRLLRMLCLGTVLSTGAGCGYDPYYYDTVYYDPYWYDYDAALSYAWVDPFGTYYVYSGTQGGTPLQLDLNSIANGLVNAANAYFTPSGCATVTANGATVSYAFQDCDGPLGLVNLNGNATVQLSENNGLLVLTSSSEDLNIDGEPFLIDSTTTVAAVGAQRQATVSTRSRGLDRLDSREAQFTVSWQAGSGCVDITGQGTSTRDDKTVTTSLSGYRRCTGQCPSAGTALVVTEDRQFSATFDGSSTLQVVDPEGDTREFDLQCNPVQPGT